MKVLPLISIVMPAYNGEKYIGEAIDSIINQSYENWELLIVNDASVDKTREIALSYEKEDRRIAVIDNESNQGVSQSRNKGIQRAKGEWIAFLDSDDKWERDKLHKQVQQMLLHPKAVLFYTGSSFMNEKGTFSLYKLEVPETITYRELLKQNIISCSSVLVQKEMLLRYPMPQEDFHEDYSVWLRILREKKEAVGINEPLLMYRVSGNSKSGNKIHAAKMQFRVYRFLGLNYVKCVYYMIFYGIRNLKKYRGIYKTL